MANYWDNPPWSDEEWREFVERTIAEGPPPGWDEADENGEVHKRLAALEEVAHLFTVPELCYMALTLQAPLAWPQGHQEEAF